ncbi:hypothetical protein ACOQFV_24575 [Nocardiopsis changdeensis]|uniref:HNH endonuclease n=1 Tax=Nocardiopsis changdeensis TaxID=2831969 RepID=A0A975KUE0_9ACTN|nr:MULTISPECIES: hypothetical protein [Nocardiopsis]QUX26433.1 hypothetical protein KGD84_32565 [Nocardiopsis changdeensis]QYX40705.1 hypothetical protein K1J57_32415 [Nocardiopsis sp. MT53]
MRMPTQEEIAEARRIGRTPPPFRFRVGQTVNAAYVYDHMQPAEIIDTIDLPDRVAGGYLLPAVRAYMVRFADGRVIDREFHQVEPLPGPHTVTVSRVQGSPRTKWDRPAPTTWWVRCDTCGWVVCEAGTFGARQARERKAEHEANP